MVNHRQRLQRGYGGHFYGERLNLESVPRLPALAVRLALDDPARRPYLFVWKLDDRFVNGVGEIVEAVVVRRHDPFREGRGGRRRNSGDSRPPPRAGVGPKWGRFTAAFR